MFYTLGGGRKREVLQAMPEVREGVCWATPEESEKVYADTWLMSKLRGHG